MEFAVCNEIFESAERREAYRFARELGYKGLEVAPFTLGADPTALTAQQRDAFAREVEDAGLQVVGLHWLLAKTEGYHLTTADESIRRKTADYFFRLIDLCADLGGGVMVLGSPLQRNFAPPMTHDEAAKNAMDTIYRFTEHLSARSVALALEPLGPTEGNFLNRAVDAVELIESMAHPFVRLHLDVKAMSSEGEAVDEIIRRNANHLIHFHANDPNLLGPGMGDFDQRPVFAALREINYRGWVSVEVFKFDLGYRKILTDSWHGMQDAIAAVTGEEPKS